MLVEVALRQIPRPALVVEEIGLQPEGDRPAGRGVELQLRRRAERAVAGDLAGEVAAAEFGAAEEVFLVRRQDVARILAAAGELQGHETAVEAEQILHAGEFAGGLEEADARAGAIARGRGAQR